MQPLTDMQCLSDEAEADYQDCCTCELSGLDSEEYR